MSGKNNEDRYAILAHHLDQDNPAPSLLAILADGVGGHHAGEVAAEMAIETIGRIVSESEAARPLEILNAAIVEAGDAVAQGANTNDAQQGMGSTCACAWVIQDRLYTANVGDSRIYLVRNGHIKQLTVDHTWVQEAIDHGVIQPEQARHHPRAHVIRRYLGSKTQVVPDFRMFLNEGDTDQGAFANQGARLVPGDQVLLCSDGLTDLVEDSEILEILKNNDMDQALQTLVDLANIRGGHDNITILTLRMPRSGRGDRKLRRGLTNVRRGKARWRLILGASILVLLLVAAGTVVYNLVSQAPPGATPTPTLATFTLPPPTASTTEEAPLTATPSLTPTETPIPNTYTPWPTHTYPP
jgi:protein phosphatase